MRGMESIGAVHLERLYILREIRYWRYLIGVAVTPCVEIQLTMILKFFSVQIFFLVSRRKQIFVVKCLHVLIKFDVFVRMCI